MQKVHFIDELGDVPSDPCDARSLGGLRFFMGQPICVRGSLAGYVNALKFHDN